MTSELSFFFYLRLPRWHDQLALDVQNTVQRRKKQK